ncbi:MAG: class IV adenylate cyclase [Alphaproteobacteria bacterium]
MINEIEIKAKVKDINKVSLWLSKNCQFLRDSLQKDTLFDFIPSSFILDEKTLHSNEFMRIRHTNFNDILTHKIIKTDVKGNFLYCDEKETIINPSNINEIKQILSSFNINNIKEDDCQTSKSLHSLLIKNNFKELITITKERKEYKIDDFNIALDNVCDLGYFIEIENLQKTSDIKTIDSIKQKALNILQTIQIPFDDIINKGYLDLIMEKRNERLSNK